jgi:hypothetical protein
MGPWDSRQIERLLFHGTKRTCTLGEDLENVDPCTSSACSLCGIVKKSFDVALCGESVLSTTIISALICYRVENRVL